MPYPRDENGDALRRMEAAGDDLTRSRDVEFTVVFPSKKSAEEFAKSISTQGYEAEVEFSETVEGLPWDVIVVKHMAPSYAEIGNFEALLQSVADRFGGRNDGWGSFSEPKTQ
jgi:hypothetical protein